MSLTYAARVLEVDDAGPIVRVPMLGGGASWGPLASSVPDLEVDDQVLVTPVGEAADRLHVVARLHARQTRQSEVPGLVARLEAIEALDAAQDGRLGGIDALNGAQNGRLSSLEGRASAVETVNGQQTTRLDGIDTLNTQQNGRLSATEGVANGAQAAVTALDAAALHRTGAESAAGVKTFTDEPVVPVASRATSPVRADDPRLTRCMCKVKLTGPASADPNLAGFVTSTADVWAGNAGASGTGVWTAHYDPFGMFVPGPPHKIVAPLDGIYRCTYRTQWLNSTNTTDSLVAFIARGAASSANTFARDVRRCIAAGNDGSPVIAFDDIDLTAGQGIFWGNWSSVNARIGLGMFPLTGTMITVTYLGRSSTPAA